MEQGKLISTGEKLHVVTRRLFEDDLRRHFVGEVVATDGALARLRGFALVFDSAANQFVRRPETRTRIVKLDNALIVNVILPTVVLDDLVYTLKGRTLVITDNADFSLEINEFGANR